MRFFRCCFLKSKIWFDIDFIHINYFFCSLIQFAEFFFVKLCQTDKIDSAICPKHSVNLKNRCTHERLDFAVSITSIF